METCNHNRKYRTVGARQRRAVQAGYTLAGALCLLAVMSILMALAVQSWVFIKQRENEEELIFRGKEYMEAIGRYHAKFNSFPPDVETLLKQKMLRREYKDPMTESGKWKVLRPDSLLQTGAAGQVNVPGQQGQSSAQQPDDNEQEDEPGKIPTGFHNQSQTQSTENEDQTEADKNNNEDPETSVIGPIVGVVSRSKKTSIRVYNNQNTYNKWYFVYALPQQQQQQQQKQKQPQTKPN